MRFSADQKPIKMHQCPIHSELSEVFFSTKDEAMVCQDRMDALEFHDYTKNESMKIYPKGKQQSS